MRLVTVLLATILPLLPTATSGGDGGSDFLYGTDGSSVSVSGTQRQDNVNSSNTPRSNAPTQNGTPAPPAGPSEEAIRLAECLDESGTTRCVRPQREETAAPAPDAPSAPGAPVVTITDLAQFAPDATVVAAEPDNVGVAGMPTNFAAAASVQTRTGTLFGAPIVARFTPVGYDYTFGDGTSATTTTAGQSWEALGQAPFTPTPTSHTYRERGTYNARVDVRYTAEIDLGSGWIPLSGQLTSRGTAVQIRIFEARTALVAYTCEEAPGAPGC